MNGCEAKLYTTEQVVPLQQSSENAWETRHLAWHAVRCIQLVPTTLPILYCALRLTIKSKRTAHRSGHRHSLQTRHLSSFSSVFVHSRFTALFTSQKSNYFSQWYVCLYKVRTKKWSLYRPLGLQEVETPSISIQSAHEGGNVSPTHRPPLLPRRYSNTTGTHLLEAEWDRKD
jgi:hypothetical protein